MGGGYAMHNYAQKSRGRREARTLDKEEDDYFSTDDDDDVQPGAASTSGRGGGGGGGGGLVDYGDDDGPIGPTLPPSMAKKRASEASHSPGAGFDSQPLESRLPLKGLSRHVIESHIFPHCGFCSLKWSPTRV